MDRMSAGSSGSQDAPLNLQTGTPSFQALSARLSLMPLPGEVSGPQQMVRPAVIYGYTAQEVTRKNLTH